MTASSSHNPALDVSSTRTPAYVVTLIHGTYPGRRKWTQPNSELRRTLENQLQGGVEFRCVRWSGANRARSRLKAAEQVQRELEQALWDYPDASHFVVAHSHGGNAVMYALRDELVRLRLTGLITLATPFLHVGEFQANERSVRGALWLLLLLGMTALFSIPIVLAVHFDFGLTWERALGAVLMSLIIASLWYRPYLPSKERVDRLVEGFSKLRAELTFPEQLQTPVLILRTTGDEASATLAMSQLMSWLVAQVTRAVAWGMDKANPDHPLPIQRRCREEKLSFAALLVSCWVGSLYLMGILSPQVKDSELALGFVGSLIASPVFALVFFAASLIALWVVLRVVLAVLLLVRALTMAPFGADVALASMVLDVTAEATPPGPWQILHIPASSSTSTPLGWLAHSRIYTDSIAISAIVSFIQKTGRTRARLVVP